MTHSDMPNASHPSDATIAAVAEQHVGETARPGGVVAVGACVLVLGTMGLFGTITGVFGLVVSQQMQGGFFPGPNAGQLDEEAQQAQEEMQRAAFAIQRKHLPLSVAAMTATALVSLALIFGGIQVIRVRKGAHKMMITILIVAIIVEMVKIIPTCLAQLEAFAVNEAHLPALIADSAEAGAEEMEQVIEVGMKAVKIVMLVFLFGWLTVKLLIYGLSVRYLRKPRIRALFGDAIASFD